MMLRDSKDSTSSSSLRSPVMRYSMMRYSMAESMSFIGGSDGLFESSLAFIVVPVAVALVMHRAPLVVFREPFSYFFICWIEVIYDV